MSTLSATVLKGNIKQQYTFSPWKAQFTSFSIKNASEYSVIRTNIRNMSRIQRLLRGDNG